MKTKKIVIIEDDPDILDLMTYILSDEGYEIIQGKDSSLLGQLNAINPQMIFMDNRLTDGFGAEYCKLLKANPETAGFPVVLFSANRDLEKMACESGADGFLEKPFNIEDLLVLVKQFDEPLSL